ncbi:MAG: 50S ribosomal protein L15, partial [Patescibacteria group bacterium]
MQLHHIKPNHKLKKVKRVARGGKRGGYSGRGIKGQKSRAGAGIRPAIRDLMMRLPKQRGRAKHAFKS